MNTSDFHVTGTLMWYYYVCHREVWLMAHKIVPDQSDQNIDYGRFLHENTYQRDKKEISVGHLKFDMVRRKDGQLIVGEVKKSSKHELSAKMQLAHYLTELRSIGINARGELLFPQEKKKIDVELTPDLVDKIEQAKSDILRIVYLPGPPQVIKNKFCSKCAYAEMCWA
ncbi:MAG: CRISPR-associated protein Cas4 [Bacillota bacterium]|jgi:CRISPR-associated exonuclease Cas4